MTDQLLACLTAEDIAPALAVSKGRDSIQVTRWAVDTLRSSATRGVFRVSGDLDDAGVASHWSLILKVERVGSLEAGSDPLGRRNGRREALAYRSGALRDLPGIEAVRCHGVQERDGGFAWLWLEDLADTFAARGEPWPARRYELAARHLGRFNGAFLSTRPLLTHEWLARGWLRRWVQENRPANVDYLDDRIPDPHSAVRDASPPGTAAGLRALWADAPRLLDGLDRLPQTLCHQDAFRLNLFSAPTGKSGSATDVDYGADPEERTVAVDWAFVGIAGVGEDAGAFAAASLLYPPPDATDLERFERALRAAYLAGLADAGWDGDPELALFGYAASAALRWGHLPMLALSPAALADEDAATKVRRLTPLAVRLLHLAELARLLLPKVDARIPR